jgi:glutamyl-tRNA reductase
VITAGTVRRVLAQRDPARGPLVLLDLALPRDVDPAATGLAGLILIDLATLAAAEPDGAAGSGGLSSSDADVAAVRKIVAEAFAAHLSAHQAARVAPTVVALRAKADEVVDRELARLQGRLGDLDERTQREVTTSMRRIADKLLHAPTVRVKQLAGSPGADSYDTALRVLFDLDLDAVRAVTRADAGLAGLADDGSEAAR